MILSSVRQEQVKLHAGTFLSNPSSKVLTTPKRFLRKKDKEKENYSSRNRYTAYM